VNLALRSLRGPAGRRAVIAAGVIGLAAMVLAAVEGGAEPARDFAQRRPARQAGGPANARPVHRNGALTAGLRLLDQAARAARQTSYQGIQVISWRTPDDGNSWLGSGASTVTVDVWHRRGGGTLTWMAAPSSGTWSSPASQPPDGVLGLTPALIGLLGTHYTVRPAGTGSVDGRPATIVEALRDDGSLAARFWLDRATKLPLRRELFDAKAYLISDEDFASLTLGAPSAQRASGDRSRASSAARASAGGLVSPSGRASPARPGAQPATGARIAISIPAAAGIPRLSTALAPVGSNSAAASRPPVDGPAGSSATGGSATGGSATGSSATGSSATGSSATGGGRTGSSATGGGRTGSSATGGSATGSSPAGSSPAGSSATGGSRTGSSATGGSATGSSPAASGSPAASPPATVTSRPVFRPWADRLGPVQLAALRSGGWPVPGPLPGGLTLFDASQAATATGKVVDLAYSDGLSVVSVFVQRGRLPAALPGWRDTDLSGNQLYVRDPGEPNLTWSADGFVYTVVAGAPARTVAAVVNALPHQVPVGFWGRMKRGIRRLLSWVNPFR
jgi:hypothetical protein